MLGETLNRELGRDLRSGLVDDITDDLEIRELTDRVSGDEMARYQRVQAVKTLKELIRREIHTVGELREALNERRHIRGIGSYGEEFLDGLVNE